MITFERHWVRQGQHQYTCQVSGFMLILDAIYHGGPAPAWALSVEFDGEVQSLDEAKAYAAELSDILCGVSNG